MFFPAAALLAFLPLSFSFSDFEIQIPKAIFGPPFFAFDYNRTCKYFLNDGSIKRWDVLTSSRVPSINSSETGVDCILLMSLSKNVRWVDSIDEYCSTFGAEKYVPSNDYDVLLLAEMLFFSAYMKNIEECMLLAVPFDQKNTGTRY
uniref:C-type lectin domain-containing protein n=1 Tax=Syphacia muris TaxID=451379 RepID=A0A0N5AZN6_9BILA